MKTILLVILGLLCCYEGYSQHRKASVTDLTVQQKLDAGRSPCDIIHSGIPLDSLYGKRYQGGFIFFINTSTCEGMVVAPGITQQPWPDPQSSPWIKWGCTGTGAPQNNSAAVNTGEQNTNDLINACPEPGTAAKIARQYDDGIYNDWFLPSKDELILIFNRVFLPDPDAFGVCTAWSSTEVNKDQAWMQMFLLTLKGEPLPSTNGMVPEFKGSETPSVRPVRRFKPETHRNLSNDLLLAQSICQCNGKVPSFLISAALSHGYTVSDLLSAGVAISGLLSAGVTVADIISAGANVTDLVNAGAKTADLLSAGANVADLVQAKVSVTDLLQAGVGFREINEAGGSLSDLMRAGVPLEATFDNEILFIHPRDFATLVPWGTQLSVDFTQFKDGDGKNNTREIVKLMGRFNGGKYAARICEDLVAFGFDDWYLPSWEELSVLRNQFYSKLPKTERSGFFNTTDYWSSNPELGVTNGLKRAFSLNFDFPSRRSDDITLPRGCRCVRR